MGAILTTFGIDWHLLLINAINFGLLLAGLTFFLYKPLAKMLSERKDKIAKGVEDAKAAEVVLQEIESSRKDTLAKAGEEADDILSHSRQAAVSKAKELMNQAEAAAARAIAEAEKQGGELKARAIEESKQEVAKMIVLGIEKLRKNLKMNLASSYARAVYEVAAKEGAKSSDILKNMHEALKRRGHEKLLPKIYSEYEKLEIKENRSLSHQKVTPEAERTRNLLELYRKLISTPTA